jgi:hypothetical protein
MMKNETGRDLDAVLQTDESRSLVVFVDKEIKPPDDRGLLGYFSYWALFKVKSFCKFIAIGSRVSPEELEDVDAQAEGNPGIPAGAQRAHQAQALETDEYTADVGPEDPKEIHTNMDLDRL